MFPLDSLIPRQSVKVPLQGSTKPQHTLRFDTIGSSMQVPLPAIYRNLDLGWTSDGRHGAVWTDSWMVVGKKQADLNL